MKASLYVPRKLYCFISVDTWFGRRTTLLHSLKFNLQKGRAEGAWVGTRQNARQLVAAAVPNRQRRVQPCPVPDPDSIREHVGACLRAREPARIGGGGGSARGGSTAHPATNRKPASAVCPATGAAGAEHRRQTIRHRRITAGNRQTARRAVSRLHFTSQRAREGGGPFGRGPHSHSVKGVQPPASLVAYDDVLESTDCTPHDRADSGVR